MKVVNCYQTCTACPSQWEGTIEGGDALYIRYRSGRLAVSVGPTLDDAVWPDGTTGHYLLQIDHGDDLAGYMNTQTMQRLTSHVLEWPC